MHVILAGPYPNGTLERFQQALPGATWTEAKTQEVYDSLTDGDVIVVRVLKTTAQTLQPKGNLKAVIRWGVGYDTVDIQAAGKQGVQVAVTPGVNAYAVSELAVTLMLALERRLRIHDRMAHQGIWDNKKYANEMTSLNHKTVGIIGGGNIGRRVASQVRAFGARTVYYDAFRLSPEMEKEHSLTWLPLEELLSISDVVTVHVPLLDSTRHLLDREQLSMMKETAILINTARGGIVNDLALAQRLGEGKLAGAGLDCVEDEAAAAALFGAMDNVILTPHMGGTTNDLPMEMVPRIAQQIRLLKESGKLNHVVNKEFLEEKTV